MAIASIRLPKPSYPRNQKTLCVRIYEQHCQRYPMRKFTLNSGIPSDGFGPAGGTGAGTFSLDCFPVKHNQSGSWQLPKQRREG
jgi:hypothetical protein